MENVGDGPDLNRTFPLRRKAAKRTKPRYSNLASSPWQLRIPASRSDSGIRITGYTGLQPQLSWYVASPQDEDIPATKKLCLGSIMKSTVAETNDAMYIDLCSDSDNKKPKPKEDSSSIDARVETFTISSLLGKRDKPIAPATAEAATTIASPDVAMALPSPANADDDVDVDDDHNIANTDSMKDGCSLLC
jgi:hypothetical protein